jgi:hypothetical protein
MHNNCHIMEDLLTSEDRLFLKGLIRPHLDYYSLLIGHPQCTERNKLMYEFISSIWTKLSFDIADLNMLDSTNPL